MGVELSLAVNPRIVLYLLGNVVAGFALSNRPVAIESIDGIEPEFVDDFLKRLVPRTKLKYVNQEDTARVEDTHAPRTPLHTHTIRVTSKDSEMLKDRSCVSSGPEPFKQETREYQG